MALMEAGAGDGGKREAFRAAFRASINLIVIRAFPLLRAEFRDLLCLYLGSRVAGTPSV
jgi:hypothetical protein